MAMLGDYEIIDEQNGLALLRRDDGQGTVVGIDRAKGQVYSAMPGDMPREGGTWFAGMSTYGVGYVAGWYSWGYARQVYRQYQKETAAQS